VDRLEKLGHVGRSTGRQDRRKIFVELTPTGAALVGKVHDDMVTNLLKMMDLLDPAERKSWLQIYEKIFTYCRPT
jgi:DNA-binding MarR family transcriptional regulator